MHSVLLLFLFCSLSGEGTVKNNEAHLKLSVSEFAEVNNIRALLLKYY